MEEIYIHNENNDFQYFETLKKNRNKRHSSGEFIVEGVRNINECLKNNWTVSGAIYSAGSRNLSGLSDWAKNILRNFALKNAEFYNLDKGLMQKLSDKKDKDDTSELILIVKIKNGGLNQLELSQNSTVLIFDRPSNKGNLGTVIRTCDSFGADALLITGHAVDLYDTETVRATMGSFFKQKIFRVPSFAEFTDWLGMQKSIFPNLKTIGTSAKAEKLIHTINPEEFADSPNIILIGNETMGLSKNFFELCDILVKIPMHAGSSASSLNAACAAAIVLYEFTKHKI
jgi:TrmH family RNA methyltransferase